MKLIDINILKSFVAVLIPASVLVLDPLFLQAQESNAGANPNIENKSGDHPWMK